MLLSPILVLDSAKVNDDLAFLMGCLREVLEESGEQALAAQLPWLGTPRRAPRGSRQIDGLHEDEPAASLFSHAC